MDFKSLAIYFLGGGTVVAVTSYFGTQGKGMLAAFIAFIPSVTVVTLWAIYSKSGAPAATSYVKGMLQLLPAWTLYAIVLFYLLPRMGLWPSLLISIAVYMVGSFITIRIIG